MISPLDFQNRHSADDIYSLFNKGGHPALGAAYAVASILFGVLAALAGQMLVQ